MLIANTCTCIKDRDGCEGDCWDFAFDDFEKEIAPLLERGSQFSIQGFPVWNGTRDGEFEATDARTFLDKITPSRTEWNLAYDIKDCVLTGRLSHHDGNGTIKVTNTND